MYTKEFYSFPMTFRWSRKPFLMGWLYSTFIVFLYLFFKYNYGISIHLPWQPVSVLGIGVAFYLGFKNSASYDRTWEARKIWGGIVNSSRSFAASTISFIKNDPDGKIKKELIYRHIAWLTALRYQLRLARDWEHLNDRLNYMFSPTVCSEYFSDFEISVKHFLPKEEIDFITKKSNMATHLMQKQVARIEEIHEKGDLDLFKMLEMKALINTFFDEQGKCERIKNFPFPRQYASTTLWITWIFAILLPWSMNEVFSDLSLYYIWLNIPLTALIIWVFFLMEKIGDYSENPFEGSYNDVPITSIARGIEIDLREMINDENIPKTIPSEKGFLL